MTTKKKTPVSTPDQFVKPAKKGATRAITKTAAPKPIPAIAKKALVAKKTAGAKPTGYENLDISQMRERIEQSARDLATGQGKDAADYRKYLASIFYFSYELAQKSLGSEDDLDLGQAQVSDELDGGPFNDLVDNVSGGMSQKDAETLRTALRREEVRLAFLLK
jgi:hypothetical protein